MNRRTFISTLTALAGIVLAKVKAPAAPKYIAGVDPALALDESAIQVWEWIQVAPGKHTYQERLVSRDELNADFDAIVSRVSGRTHCWAKKAIDKP